MAPDRSGDYRALQAALRASARDLLATPTRLARGLDPGYVVRPWARVIGEAMAELEAGTSYRRLMIILPSQVGKSTLVNEWGCFWWLCRNPTHQIISTSYGDDLARSRGIRVRDLVTEHGHLYDLAHTQARPSARHFRLVSGGAMRSVSMGRTITGFPAHLLVIDDPFKDRADAESPARREAVWDWYSSTGSQRLQPDSPVVVINTRWHIDDLSGRLLKRDGDWDEGGRWKVLHFPAAADPRFGDDPIGREPGGWLPHPLIKMRDGAALARHWETKRSDQTVRDWHAMAQGDPKPVAGALVSYALLQDLRAYSDHAPPLKSAVAIDPSGGGRDLAGVIGGHLGDDMRLWITHDASLHGGSDEWTAAACRLAAQIDADAFVIEKNFGGDMAGKMLRLTWEKLGRDHDAAQDRAAAAAADAGRDFTPEPNPYPPAGMPMIVEVTAKKGKLLRAELVAQQMKMDKIRIGARMLDLEEEWSTWMPTDTASPGRLDGSVYLAFHLLRIAGAARVISVAGHKRGDGPGGALGGRRIPR